MIFYYLDASAWVKRYYQESGTAWIQDLFRREPTIASASLGFVEVMATLARKTKAREIRRTVFARKVSEIEEDWKSFVQIHLSAEAVERAKDIAKEQALRGADAVHLSSALLLQSRFVEEGDRLIFVASDRELKEAAQEWDLEVLDPVDHDDQR